MSLKLRYLVLPGVLIAACEVPLVVQSSAPIAGDGAGGSTAGATSEGGALNSAGSPEPEGGRPTGSSGSGGSVMMGEGGDAGAGGSDDELPPCLPPLHELIADEVATGEGHACAIQRGTGHLYCWGDGVSGQLGNDKTEPSNLPVLALPEKSPPDPFFVSVQAGTNTTCALAQDKKLYCTGNNFEGVLAHRVEVGTAIPLVVLDGVDAFALNGGHVLARVGAKLYAWGSNELGQLGLGDVDVGNAVKQIKEVPLGFEPGLLAAGSKHSCITRADSTEIYCAGNNYNRQLGFSDEPKLTKFTNISRSGAELLALGHDRSCAILKMGYVVCWGKNDPPTLSGRPEEDIPTPADLDKVPDRVNVSIGFDHMCVSGQDLHLRCSGHNEQGELGNELGTSAMLVAPKPAFNSVKFSAGWHFTCAIRSSDGAVVCFGANDHGQLGRGTTDLTTPGAPGVVCLPPP